MGTIGRTGGINYKLPGTEFGTVAILVKGVHNNVIEINDTGSDCFERAILFVRQDKQDADKSWLQARGKRYIKGLQLRGGMIPRARLWMAVLKYGAAISAGAALATALLKM